MLLKLHDSKIFTVDTAQRFAEEYNCSPKLWNDIWARYLSGYDEYGLAGYFMYKTNQRIKARTIKRWITKTEVYCRANHVMLMGVRVVQSEYFGVYEDFVIEEVLRNMKYRGTQDSRAVV